MALTFSVLVVANRTADSPELVEALRARAARGPARFTLLAPAAGGEAPRRLEAGLERLRAAGLEVDGRVGDPLPIEAVADVWDPREFDEIIVSTLAPAQSKWLAADLPHQIARLTDMPVSHVAASERRPAPASPPISRPERHGLLEGLFYGGVGHAPPGNPRPPARAQAEPVARARRRQMPALLRRIRRRRRGARRDS